LCLSTLLGFNAELLGGGIDNQSRCKLSDDDLSVCFPDLVSVCFPALEPTADVLVPCAVGYGVDVAGTVSVRFSTRVGGSLEIRGLLVSRLDSRSHLSSLYDRKITKFNLQRTTALSKTR
jgi:hypothetical protein